MKPWKKRACRFIVYGGMSALIAFALVMEYWPVRPALFFPEWNCEIQEINIRTGQARFRNCRFFIKVCEEIRETVLSKALSQPIVVETDLSPWNRVNTFSPPSFHVSPHHIFHGALSQVHELELIFRKDDLPAEKRGQIATNVLILWQKSNSVHGADKYLQSLWQP
jgi:hypothetical protein